MDHEVSYGCIPIRTHEGEFQVLLVRHSHGLHWGFPKGHPEKGETPEETALRELCEETGVKDCSLMLEKAYSESYTFSQDRKHIAKTVTYFLATAKDECSNTAPDEIADLRWVSFDEAETAITFPEARDVWRQARPVAEKKLKISQ